MENSNKPKTPQAVQACHDLLLWIIPHLDKFPRSRRFTLGVQIENSLLNVLENLVDAAYSQQKQNALRQANRQLEINRHLWRLAYELQVIPIKSYEHGIKLMNDVGRQVGGWLQSCQNA
jgi:hypothetical protein